MSLSTQPFKILCLRGTIEGETRTFPLEASTYRIGRSSASDISLQVHGVSREHAILYQTLEGLMIKDLGSRNGTFVDNQRVERAPVAYGAEIRFGSVCLQVDSLDADDVALAFTLTDPGLTVTRDVVVTPEDDEPTVAQGAAGHAQDGYGLVFPADYHPGVSPLTMALYRQLRQLLTDDLAVLLVGETGVGKEHVAKTIHASCSRSKAPFVAINCAAIPAEMLEAELFGIGRGVATGVKERAGQFELAEGGVLFLDEIGEMAPALQAKLLRALQEKEIQPVGKPARRLDVRVIAATNADLDQRMDTGLFRRDLFYRLAGHKIELPPLRRSKEDIPGLVEHFLRRFASQAGIRIRGVSAKALDLLVANPWPGNVRELQHEMHRLVGSSTDGQVIDSGMLAHRWRDHPPDSPPDGPPESSRVGESLALEPKLRELEERLIREALRRSGGKRIEAAKLLEISRNGLAKKMKRLGIDS